MVLPNDPDLVDILAKNGVDISVSEGEQQGNFVSLLGNLLFPLIAFGGLFFLFRRAQARPEAPTWARAAPSAPRRARQALPSHPTRAVRPPASARRETRRNGWPGVRAGR